MDASNPGAPVVWEHHTPDGVEYGAETPTGRRPSDVKALFDALALTWRIRQTLWVVVVNQYKARYRAQSLGMFWSLANPLVMMATLTIAFTYILRIPIPNFAIFYLTAAIFWHFFVNAVTEATGSLFGHGGLVKRTNFPRFLLPVAAVLVSLINFGMEGLLLLAFYFVFPDAYRFSAAWLILPVLVLLVLVMSIGIGLLTSALNVRFRDVQYVVGSIFMMGFWLTPILYSTSMAPPFLARILRLNPLAGVVEGARAIVMHGYWPDPVSLLPATICAVIFFFAGAAFFRRANLKLADYV